MPMGEMISSQKKRIDELCFWLALNEWTYSNRFKTLPKIKERLEKLESKYVPYDIANCNFARGLINYLEKLKINEAATVQVINSLLNSGVSILTYLDEEYPPQLRKIPDPPVVLFHKGKLRKFDKCIAIVGSRNPSHYARKKAREIARVLARNKYTIVSGLARGIDTEAHCGALDVNGKTIAVLGTKINDEIYPKENSRLAEDIMRSGAIISEAPLFQQSKNTWFIRRNRITSGISLCLIVIEFGSTGGTFTQVEHAINQGKPIFVLKPKRKSDELAMKGYNEAIEKGAIPITSGKEILKYLETLEENITSLNKYDISV